MAKLTNAEKQRAYRAKKKAEAAAASQTPGGIASNAGAVVPPGEDDVQVEVRMPEPTPQLSLKERFMNRLQGKAPTTSTPKTKGRASAKKADSNLLTTVLPTVLASLVSVYAQNLMPDEYKPCAPTKEEVSGVLGPLFDILGRRVEVIGKASQDAIDVVNSLICAFMYGTRAYITYMDIKKTKETPAYVEQKREAYQQKLDREAREYNDVVNGPDPNAHLVNGLRSYQAASNGRGGNGNSISVSPTNEYATKDDVERLYGTSEDGDSEGRPTEAAQVAELFGRDRAGRVRLGLLPV